MPRDNLQRAFGDDLVLLVLGALPLVALFLAVRLWTLRSRPHRITTAMLEVLILGAAAVIATVTLIPSQVSGGLPREVDWRLLSSDLTYAPQRSQIIGNLMLFAPLVYLVVLRTGTRRPLVLGATLSLVLPAVVESIQYAGVSGRAVTLEDWFLGAVGAMVATVLAAMTLRAASPRFSPRNSPAHVTEDRVTV